MTKHRQTLWALWPHRTFNGSLLRGYLELRWNLVEDLYDYVLGQDDQVYHPAEVAAVVSLLLRNLYQETKRMRRPSDSSRACASLAHQSYMSPAVLRGLAHLGLLMTLFRGFLAQCKVQLSPSAARVNFLLWYQGPPE